MQSSVSRYTPVAIALHWLMALGLIGAIGVGWYTSELPMSVQRLKLINWHKWFGITLLALAALRLVWRATHRPPPDLPMPASGTASISAYSNAAGFPVVWFGVLPLPDLVGKDAELMATLKEVHKLLAWGLAGLILAHVAGALKHQFVDRDGLLARMGLGART